MAARKKTLSEKQFRALAQKLQALHARSETSSVESKLKTYWSYGQLIEEQKLSSDLGYHNSILRDLAHATGISLRTLQQSVLFRKHYERPPLGDGLSWSHVRVLSRLATKKQRDFYAELTRQEGWTSKELQKAISADLYAGGDLRAPKLERPTKPSFLYKTENVRVIDGDTIEVLIDLGFDSFTKRSIRLAQINCPEVRTKSGREARNFLVETLATAKTIIIKTHKADLHGRYIGHVFASSRKLSIDDCFEHGTHINDLLVREKHARVVG